MKDELSAPKKKFLPATEHHPYTFSLSFLLCTPFCYRLLQGASRPSSGVWREGGGVDKMDNTCSLQKNIKFVKRLEVCIVGNQIVRDSSGVCIGKACLQLLRLLQLSLSLSLSALQHDLHNCAIHETGLRSFAVGG